MHVTHYSPKRIENSGLMVGPDTAFLSPTYVVRQPIVRTVPTPMVARTSASRFVHPPATYVRAFQSPPAETRITHHSLFNPVPGGTPNAPTHLTRWSSGASFPAPWLPSSQDTPSGLSCSPQLQWGVMQRLDHMLMCSGCDCWPHPLFLGRGGLGTPSFARSWGSIDVPPGLLLSLAWVLGLVPS